MGGQGSGRHPIPNEIKRMTGRTMTTDAGGRPLPALRDIAALVPARVPPEPPEDLLPPGRELWQRAWSEAIVWLSPDSDWPAVERACRLTDAYRKATDDYMNGKHHLGDRVKLGGLVVKLSKELGAALGDLGFSPTARTRMGVAEVKRVSKIEELRRRREEPEPRPAPDYIDGDFEG